MSRYWYLISRGVVQDRMKSFEQQSHDVQGGVFCFQELSDVEHSLLAPLFSGGCRAPMEMIWSLNRKIAGGTLLSILLVVLEYQASYGKASMQILDQGCMMLFRSSKSSTMGLPIDGIKGLASPVVLVAQPPGQRFEVSSHVEFMFKAICNCAVVHAKLNVAGG